MRKLALMAAMALLFLVPTLARADVITVANPQGWTNGDTRPGGSIGITSNNPRSGNGSLEMSTNDPAAKAQWQRPNASGYGTVGSITSIGFDWNRSSTSTAAAHFAPVMQIQGFNGNGQFFTLTCERAYNYSDAAPTDTWVTENAIGQVWWLRIGGVNYDIVADMRTLQDWANDPRVGANAQVYNYLLGFGSGVSGQFRAYVDNAQIGFNNQPPVISNFEAESVPEPASIFLFATGIAGTAGWMRKRFKR